MGGFGGKVENMGASCHLLQAAHLFEGVFSKGHVNEALTLFSRVFSDYVTFSVEFPCGHDCSKGRGRYSGWLYFRCQAFA